MRVNTPWKHRGAWAELVACKWLLSEGYEVFRNVSQCGAFDVIALRDNEILKIDVKGYTKGKNYSLGARARFNQAGVTFLLVSDDGDCHFAKPMEIETPFICENCGGEFSKKDSKRRYCSFKCRKAAFLTRRAAACELAV